ncbi:ESCRT II complex subunit Dot2, partial [Pestalotiopsis sp. IQ-011]
MNDDAGGRGIRITSWVMIMLTFVLAYCGLFYNSLVLGMAIGFGLNFAQVYFALALLLQSRMAGPYPADIAIGIMILDALNAASATQLSMKRLLVHPVWTVITLIGQAVGLMAIGLLLHYFMLGHYE